MWHQRWSSRSCCRRVQVTLASKRTRAMLRTSRQPQRELANTSLQPTDKAKRPSARKAHTSSVTLACCLWRSCRRPVSALPVWKDRRNGFPSGAMLWGAGSRATQAAERGRRRTVFEASSDPEDLKQPTARRGALSPLQQALSVAGALPNQAARVTEMRCLAPQSRTDIPSLRAASSAGPPRPRACLPAELHEQLRQAN